MARSPLDAATLPDLLQRTSMGRAPKSLGRVVERKGSVGVVAGRFRIDLGSHYSGRYVTSFHGQPLTSREFAEAVLAFIEAQAARGRSVEDIVAELAPEAAAAHEIGPLMERWLANFRQRVETERRAPRTLEDYARWVEGSDDAAYLRHWHGKTLAEVDSAAVEEWDAALHRSGLAPKTRKNVLAAFHAFLAWVHEQRPTFALPKFPWPELDDRAPMILAPELQAKVIEAIPWAKRGIFLAMAETLVRPSEARALRVRDWTADGQLRVVRAAKDHRTRGVVRGLKSRNTKTLPIIDSMVFIDFGNLSWWLVEHVERPGRRLSDPDGPLFANPDGEEGGWWSKSALRRTWSAACAKVGVSGASLYSLKHSGMTALKALGLDDRTLAALAGHRDLRSVGFYAHLDSTMVREAIIRLREREERERDRKKP